MNCHLLSPTIALLMAATVALSAAAQPARESNPEKPGTRADKPKQINRGDLVGNVQLLNLWGDQPEAVQRLYEAVGATDRLPSFAIVTRNCSGSQASTSLANSVSMRRCPTPRSYSG